MNHRLCLVLIVLLGGGVSMNSGAATTQGNHWLRLDRDGLTVGVDKDLGLSVYQGTALLFLEFPG